jgi:hypothetical protein
MAGITCRAPRTAAHLATPHTPCTVGTLATTRAAPSRRVGNGPTQPRTWRNARVRASKGFGDTAVSSSEKPRSLLSRVRHDLKGISLTFVGDSSALNRAVATVMADRLQYVPLHTEAIIEQLVGQSAAEIVAEEGPSGLGIAEVQVMATMQSQIRSCISTCGYGAGVAARADAWRYLFGQIVVWLDVDASRSEAESPQRGAYELSELHLELDPEVTKSPEETAQSLVEPILTAVEALLQREFAETTTMDYPGRKNLYMKLGCRGDWPNIQSPEWVNPMDLSI